jgi:hypothetical protein
VQLRQLESQRTALTRLCRACAEFQQMDIDTIVGPPHAEWMRGAPPQVAIIRMFGVTAAGACAALITSSSGCSRWRHAVHRKQRLLPYTRLSAVLLRSHAVQLCPRRRRSVSQSP